MMQTAVYADTTIAFVINNKSLLPTYHTISHHTQDDATSADSGIDGGYD
jgi:hypothetical protein